MHLQYFPLRAATAFVDHAMPFLLAHEAEHNLFIDVVQRAMADPATMPDDAYFATVTDEQEQLLTAAFRTPPMNVALARTESGHMDALALLVVDLQRRFTRLPGVLAEKATAHAFAESWQRFTGVPYTPLAQERLHRLDRLQPLPTVPGTMRPIRREDRALLVRWVADFNTSAPSTVPAQSNAAQQVDAYYKLPHRRLFVWEDRGIPVAMAGCTGDTPNGIRIGPVYTPPRQRGRGYATALVAALSQSLLDGGKQFCVLYTDLANPTANHIYAKIGYVPVIDVDMLKFGD